MKSSRISARYYRIPGLSLALGVPRLSMNIAVDYLTDHPDLIPEVSRWLLDEWGDRSPLGTVEGMGGDLRDRVQRDALPLALLAHENNAPVGTVSLKIREVEIRPRYEHWLGTLFVPESRRRMGIGSLLVGAAVDEARRLGINELYLYTRRLETQRLYQQLGWAEVEWLEYRGRPAIIMKVLMDAQG